MQTSFFVWGGVAAVALSSCADQAPPVDSDQPTYHARHLPLLFTSKKKTSLKISLWDQRAWLLDGKGKVLLSTDVATGVPGKETPTGEFAVLKRQKSKRSNLYGQYVNEKTGEVVVAKAWEHEGEAPEGAVWQGIGMPYWMRLTWDGVGMHVGEFKKRTRSSFGCIRVHEGAQPIIFRKTTVGTKVEIVEESLIKELGL